MSEELARLTLIELLERLDPLPDPPQISLWPQTGGWIWLGLLLLVCTAWIFRLWARRRRANTYRRAALAQIGQAGNDTLALAEILRRTALAAFPRAEVAGLYGEDWLAFLDRSYGGTAFREGPGRILALAPYARCESVEGLQALAAQWVRRHRRPERT